jgi:superfamily II DNA or RNA helicase
MSAYDQDARKALVAKQEMKRIVVGSERKLEILDSLMKQHFADKVIIFTEQNDLVYRISREFLIPAITHETRTKERKWILDGFKDGTFRAIATSKVLNEGIDVPTAKIAIVLSGSASPREYLQRLGRILRKGGDRRMAVLYEVVTSATTETGVSSRRRRTDAYA